MNSQTIGTIAAPHYEVRRMVAEDVPRLEEFYRRVLPDRPRLNDFKAWHWQFLGLPTQNGEFPYFVLVADGGRIEGGIGYLQTTLRVNERDIAAAHPVNYFVNPRYKGLPALQLFRAVLGQFPIIYGSYFSDDAARLLQRLGYKDLSDAVVSYHLPVGRSSSSAKNYIRRFWRTILTAVTRAVTSGVTHTISDTLDPRFASFNARQAHALITIRKDNEYLNWRYARSPWLHHVFVHQFNATQPSALAVLHLDKNAGEVVLLDVQMDNWELPRLIGLLCAAIRYVDAENYRLFVTHAMSAPLGRALRMLGCGHARSSLGFIVGAAEKELLESLAQPTRWHFMVGDTDRY